MFKSIWPRRRRCEPIPPGERTPSLGRSSSSDDWHGPGPDAMPPAPSQLHCSTTASACRSAACGDRFRRCAELRPELVERPTRPARAALLAGGSARCRARVRRRASRDRRWSARARVGVFPLRLGRGAGCNGPASASVLIPSGARAVTRPLVQGGRDL